jgi:hypothetical protein
VLQRKARGRVQFTNSDRLFFIQLYRWFPAILKAMTIIRPETLVRWHRAGFRRYWRWKSRNLGGRPRIEVRLSGQSGPARRVHLAGSRAVPVPASGRHQLPAAARARSVQGPLRHLARMRAVRVPAEHAGDDVVGDARIFAAAPAPGNVLIRAHQQQSMTVDAGKLRLVKL